MDRAAVLARLKQFEGIVPHMYRCTGGEVTIGIGHAIANVSAAAQLTWEINGAPAAAAQAQADFQRVAAAQQGLMASSYAGMTSCRMNTDGIDRLAQADIQSFEAQLLPAMPKWNSLPAPAQEALFDMAFNLGIGGLKKFPKLLQAVDAGDWNAAAAECHRQGISEARNQETASLFQQAAEVE